MELSMKQRKLETSNFDPRYDQPYISYNYIIIGTNYNLVFRSKSLLKNLSFKQPQIIHKICVHIYVTLCVCVHIYLMELQCMSHGTATKNHELAYENASISYGNTSFKFLVEGYSCLPNSVGYCHCMDDFQILNWHF